MPFSDLLAAYASGSSLCGLHHAFRTLLERGTCRSSDSGLLIAAVDRQSASTTRPNFEPYRQAASHSGSGNDTGE